MGWNFPGLVFSMSASKQPAGGLGTSRGGTGSLHTVPLMRRAVLRTVGARSWCGGVSQGSLPTSGRLCFMHWFLGSASG